MITYIKNVTYVSRGFRGFTLIELMSVIALIGIISSIAIPRLVNVNRTAKITVLEGIEGNMRAVVNTVRAAAYSQGLSPLLANPADQTELLVNFNGESTEVTWLGLCLESIAEEGDRLAMIDFITVDNRGGLSAQNNNEYTLIGYDIPGFSVPTDEGCYIIYKNDTSDCQTTIVTADC